MNYKELMVGDLMYIHEPECKGHRVDYINELDGQVGADGEVYDECDIRPIPLTEEILVKNGFGKVNNQYFFGQVEIKELRDCWIVTINKKDADVDINIHYVHQLQRLLNLCNIDKEIIL